MTSSPTTNTHVSQPAGRSFARVRADLLLLLTAIVWGSAFVAQRLSASEMAVYLFNGGRFLLAALLLIPFALSRRLKWARSGAQPEVELLSRKNLPGVILAGCLLAGGAALQQAGLVYTTAGNAGFITGLYVVLIPLFLALFWRKRPRLVILLAAGLAVLGLFLLSTQGRLQQLNRGDLLELVGTLFWAMHVIVTGLLVKRIEVLEFAIGQYLTCSVVSLLGWVWLEGAVLPGHLLDWWGLVYTGVFSVALGYTLQAMAQREAPPADAAIILSMEALFAAIFGWIFLSETLSLAQVTGCGIMLSGMLLAQVDHLRAQPA